MRGSDERSGSLFSYVDLEARVRSDHPLRTIRPIANAAPADLSGEFAALYTDFGRPSIAPEKLSNETHASPTDPEARLYRKGHGQPGKLCYMGHALMENRNGLVVGGQ